MLDKEELVNRFTYHKPKGTQIERYAIIRDKARDYAIALTDMCPMSRELTRATNKLDEVVMLANAAIARNE